MEFITSFLNNASNDEDIISGTNYANKIRINLTDPKFGISKSEYFFNRESGTIAKGLSSVKFIGEQAGDLLYELSTRKKYDSFVGLLTDITLASILNSRMIDILIKIDYFSMFGNQNELIYIYEVFSNFKKPTGFAKQISRDAADNSPYRDIIYKYSLDKNKDGSQSKKLKIFDASSIMLECEKMILSSGLKDASPKDKILNYIEYMGSAGYKTGVESDRNKLFIMDVRPVRRRKDNKIFAYNVKTRSIGSGKESEMTVKKALYEQDPILKNDIVECLSWCLNGVYFEMRRYRHFEDTIF